MGTCLYSGVQQGWGAGCCWPPQRKEQPGVCSLASGWLPSTPPSLCSPAGDSSLLGYHPCLPLPPLLQLLSPCLLCSRHIVFLPVCSVSTQSSLDYPCPCWLPFWVCLPPISHTMPFLVLEMALLEALVLKSTLSISVTVSPSCA